MANVLADLVRLAALASAVSAFSLSGVEDGVRFSVVFLASTMPWLVGRIPAAFDLVYCAALLLTTWSMTAGWYRGVAWFDRPVHAVTTGAVAAMLYLVLARLGQLPALQESARRRNLISVVLLTVALGFAAGAVWEICGWVADHMLGVASSISHADMIADLLMSGLGALLAGLALIGWAVGNRTSPATEPRPELTPTTNEPVSGTEGHTPAPVTWR